MKKFLAFTLAETLLAVMLLLIVSALMAQGVPLALNVYKKVTLAANANTLVSTTMTELRDKLAFSEYIEIVGNTISFTGNNGRSYSLAYTEDEEGIYLKDTTNDGYSDSRLLVSDPAAAKELYAYSETVELDGDVLKFSGLGVYRKNDLERKNPFILITTYDVRLLKNGD